MRQQFSHSALASLCMCALAACGGGGGSSGGGSIIGPIQPLLGEGFPTEIPINQDLIVRHASNGNGGTPTVGASIINVVNNDTITVSFAGQQYELARIGERAFETADESAVLYLPDDTALYGEHAGLVELRVDQFGSNHRATKLLGVADAYDALPDSGLATFTGGARTYRLTENGSGFENESWDVEVVANFQVMGVGATISSNSYTLEMDPAGIQNNGGTALFSEALTSSDNPDYTVTNGSLTGFFFGDGQEVGGTFTYDVEFGGIDNSVSGVLHAD